MTRAGPMGGPVPTGLLATWRWLSLLLLLMAPSQFGLGRPFWRLPPADLLQWAVWGTVFLAISVAMTGSPARRGGAALLSLFAAGGALCLAAWGFILRAGGIGDSRRIALLSAGLGFVLAVSPALLGDRLRRATLALAVTVTVTALAGPATAGGTPDAPRPVPDADPGRERITTALYPVELTFHRGLVDSTPAIGGALVPLGAGFLLVDALGSFYHLTWGAGPGQLHARRLEIRAPMDRTAYLKDWEDRGEAPMLRVTGLVVDTSTTPGTLYLAHQHWDSPNRCFTTRVSRIAFDHVAIVQPATAAWQTVFESQPCLSAEPPFDDFETGGRIVRLRTGGLLLTIGDYGHSGLRGPALAQDPSSDYGKVWRLDGSGGRALFSLGHRNPQGLLLDRRGEIWSTEHGPQGGDEINLLGPGHNYGWPLATYGTHYGQFEWPLAPRAVDHGRFTEPTHAFIPSIGISNLIEVGARQFPAWDGSLLVGSLRAKTLFRVRARGGRVIYLEPIVIGARIRDLAEGADGRVLLWTDANELVEVARATSGRDPASTYEQCIRCHGAEMEGTPSGPPLRGVVGRPIASVRGFEYSAGLKRLEGVWTESMLDEFLRDPRNVVKGTTMAYLGMLDPLDRQAMIQYLRARGGPATSGR